MRQDYFYGKLESFTENRYCTLKQQQKQNIDPYMYTLITEDTARQTCLQLAMWLLGPFLLTRFNFNPGMDKLSHAQYSVWWNYLSIAELQLCNRWSLGMDE